MATENVYLELVSRHMGGGIVDLQHEADHAYASSFSGRRASRSWKERMILLEKAGFIRIEKVGNHFKRVLLRNPTIAVQELRAAGKVPDEWWRVYRSRQVKPLNPDTKTSCKTRR